MAIMASSVICVLLVVIIICTQDFWLCFFLTSDSKDFVVLSSVSQTHTYVLLGYVPSYVSCLPTSLAYCTNYYSVGYSHFEFWFFNNLFKVIWIFD